jgi:NADP-dependent aldehyde dehydrogenase
MFSPVPAPAIVSRSPVTGAELGSVPETPSAEVAAVVGRATAAAAAVRAAHPYERAGWLRAVAAAMEAHASEIVSLADAESGLGVDRLRAELAGAARQWRFYADVAEEGSWLDVTIDHAADARPDLRRVSEADGPVAVFGASNFPLTFGEIGHDTASAMAAGAPVVIKAHPAHPRLAVLLGEVGHEALAAAGAPVGTLGMVHGFDAGLALVRHPEITAVAFTGSERGGMALRAAVLERAVPIPVYAEMGTINPVVVAGSVPATELTDLAQTFVRSLTYGSGQVCTKPGLVLVPRGSDFVDLVGRAVQDARHEGWALTESIAAAYRTGIAELEAAGASVVARSDGPGTGWGLDPAVLTAPIERVRSGSRLLAECFGPVGLLVEYDSIEDVIAVVGELPGALAAGLFAAADDPDVPRLVDRLSRRVGRIAFGVWTSGVATTWAQHHGGPWPATTMPTATSVGAAALRRFVRPVTYQGMPAAAQPIAVRDENPWAVPQRIDGVAVGGSERRS